MPQRSTPLSGKRRNRRSTKNFRVKPLAAAISAATLFGSGSAVYGQSGTEARLEEVLVTARKRTESVMDIAADVQALTEENIRAIGARNVTDISRFIPSVNVVDLGAGITDVYFRGAVSDPGNYIVQSTSSVYVDEISVTTQGQSPYIRMVDINRVEALAGPQGTLYGSDSTAGTLRIITNQPNLSEQEIVVDGSLRAGEDSDESYEGSVVVNFPIVEDTLAVRLVGFGAEDGGFIDNVFGRTIEGDRKTDAAFGRSPSGWGQIDNGDVVEDDINDVQVTGWRAAVSWQITERWNATGTVLHQETDSGSYNAFNPFVGDLEVVKFNEEYYDVEYDIYSLVLDADLGFAQLISATSYYDSDSDFVQDVTNYQKSYAAYYCILYAGNPADFPYYYAPPEGGGVVFVNTDPDSGVGAAGYCNAPTVEGDFLSGFAEEQSSDRFAQEIRLSSQGDTIDWLAGVFYEESNYSYTEFFGFPTANINGRGGRGELYQETVSLNFNEFRYGVDLPNAVTPFFADSSTDSEQIAAFGEVTWHATEKLEVALGARWFDRDNETRYRQELPNTQPGQETQKLKANDSEIAPKLSVSYDINDNQMVYALYSEGYRPGGTNRQRGNPTFSQQYDPDKLINYELGYKGTLLEDAMQVRLTAFYMDWEDFQLELTDPSTAPCPDDGPDVIAGVCGQPFQVAVANAGDAHVLGVTGELDWALTSNLVVGINAEWLEAETDTEIDEGTLFIPKGSDLPVTPEWTGAAWATYSYP
ncbi:MAG: TonB-dependent receptor, partial [Pseudomonadota bacterium]